MSTDSVYYAQVSRNPKAFKGPGTLTLYLESPEDTKEVGRYAVITGGGQLDDKKLGGLTPKLHWKMLEEIDERDHPHTNVGIMTMSRIVPELEEDRDEYPNRTFGWEGSNDWPFMIHIAGGSSGCIAIMPKHWHAAKEALNAAFRHSQENDYTFTIEVFDQDD